MSNFKIGDKVIIIKDSIGHSIPLKTEGEVRNINEGKLHLKYKDDNGVFCMDWILEEDVEEDLFGGMSILDIIKKDIVTGVEIETSQQLTQTALDGVEGVAGDLWPELAKTPLGKSLAGMTIATLGEFVASMYPELVPGGNSKNLISFCKKAHTGGAKNVAENIKPIIAPIMKRVLALAGGDMEALKLLAEAKAKKLTEEGEAETVNKEKTVEADDSSSGSSDSDSDVEDTSETSDQS